MPYTKDAVRCDSDVHTILRDLAKELGVGPYVLHERARKFGFKVFNVYRKSDTGYNSSFSAVSNEDAQQLRLMQSPYHVNSRKGEIHMCSICGKTDHLANKHYTYQQDSKPCTRCKRVLPLTEFSYHKSSKYPSIGKRAYPAGECKECSRKKEKRRRESTVEIRLRWLCDSAKSRCKKRGIPFDITTNDLVNQYHKQNGLCFYSQLPIQLMPGNHAISIDRLTPGKGYTKGNIVLTLWIVNCMKRQQTHDEFVALCRQIADNAPIDYHPG